MSASSRGSRAAICRRMVAWCVAKAEELGNELTWQMGRPVAHSAGEIRRGFEERAAYMCSIAEETLADMPAAPKEGFRRFVRREPLGVVLVVAPWNYPWLTSVNAVVPALLAGNSVILKMAAQTPPDKRLAAIVDSYLTPVHRDDPGHGCAVPTLGAEIARESVKTRKAFSAKLEQMIDMMADQVADVPRKAARKQAMAALATMIGTLVLSRIAGSGEFSDEILGAGRDAVLARAAVKPAAKKTGAKPN